MDQKVLNLLGLAKRAGKIITGEDSVIQGLQKKEIKLVFIAKDASESSLDKFSKKCYFYNVKCCNGFTCEELSNAIGADRKIIGVTDAGFTKAIMERLRGEEVWV